jgi:hypothetical protein
MSSKPHRREFLRHTTQAGLVAGLADFGFLRQLPALGAQDVRVPRSLVQLQPDIEPLVHLIEDTPRDRLLEVVAERVRGGLGYQPLLAALMLAGVRSIKPRPVGFSFHAVLVVNSAHLASQAAAERDRWLPLFWGMDNFKVSQVNGRQGNYAMPVVEEGRVPSAGQAVRRFREAMDNWDEAGADAGAAALARGLSANESYELLWRYGARDFRDIGHKAIYVANSYRTLQTIGWRHAEPILRSLVYALLEHEQDNPAQRDAEADRPGRDNQSRVNRIRADWQRGRIAREASSDLLATLRTCTPAEASEAVVTQLNNGIDPASVWDALFLTSGEFLMRQPGIVGLHTVTTTNAMHFGYETTANDETRRYLLLQAAAFLPMFRQAMRGRGNLPEQPHIDTFEPAARPEGPRAIEEIFTELSRDRQGAARKALALVQADRQQVEPLLTAARRLIFVRGTDSHDYKFSSAALEDYYHVTPAWRDRYLAGCMFWLKGAGGADTPLYRRTRAALG